MFGALLLAFELRTEKLDRLFRQNFGFMYGNQTRTIFLLLYVLVCVMYSHCCRCGERLRLRYLPHN